MMRIRISSFTGEDKIINVINEITVRDLVAELAKNTWYLRGSKVFLALEGKTKRCAISVDKPSGNTVQEILVGLNNNRPIVDGNICILIAEIGNQLWLDQQFLQTRSYQKRLTQLGLTPEEIPFELSQLDFTYTANIPFVSLFKLEKYVSAMEDKMKRGLLITDQKVAIKFISDCDENLTRLINDSTSTEFVNKGGFVLFENKSITTNDTLYRLTKPIKEPAGGLHANCNRPLSLDSENPALITLNQAKRNLLTYIANLAESQLILTGYIDLSDIYTTVKNYWNLEYPDALKDVDVMINTHRNQHMNDSLIGKLFKPKCAEFLKDHGFFNVKVAVKLNREVIVLTLRPLVKKKP
jgi:hypothetical protein